jgi:predicted ABC-type ATPase
MSDDPVQTGPRGGQFIETPSGTKRYVGKEGAAAAKQVGEQVEKLLKGTLAKLAATGWKGGEKGAPTVRTQKAKLKTAHEDDVGRIAKLPKGEQRAAFKELAETTQADIEAGKLKPEGGKAQEWLEGDENKDAWKVADKDTSWAKYYSADSKPGDPKAVPTDPARKLMQEEAKKVFVGKNSVAKPGEQKIAIIMMGGPGSGKTSSLPKDLDWSKFAKADADGLKGHLPEFRDGVKAKSMRSAGIAHEESSAMSKQVVAQAIEENRHLVMDGTGATLKSYDDAIKKLKDAGYHVQLNFVHLPYEKAEPRMFSRAEGVGRFVPLDDAKQKHRDVPSNFEHFAKQVDRAIMYDNDVPMGEPMRRIAEYGGGKVDKMHHDDFYADFKKKYPQKD